MLWRGKPTRFIKNALTLPENEFPAWVKVGAINTPSSFRTRLISCRAVTLLTTAFDPVQAFLLSVMVNARHMFYGLSLLDKYKGLGKVRAFLIYVLCDETFSLMSTLEPPEGVARRDFYFWISLLDYLYWITGTALGGLLGSFLTFDTTGLDFALTALFVVLFLEQWKKPENRPAGVMGILCAAASLAVFGADNMVIPAMVLVLAVLLGARRRLDRSGEEGVL